MGKFTLTSDNVPQSVIEAAMSSTFVTVPGGAVSFQRGKLFQVTLNSNNERVVSKCFSLKSYGGSKEKALAAAEEYRRAMSTLHKLDRYVKKDKNETHPFRCPWPNCSVASDTRQTFCSHYLTHMNTRPFKCRWDGCLDAFNQQWALTQHIRAMHTNEKPYKCKYLGCIRSFTQLPHLQKHERMQHTMERYKCTWGGCERAFGDTTALKSHLIRHSGVRSHMCSQCSASCFTLKELNQHMKTHSLCQVDDDPNGKCPMTATWTHHYMYCEAHGDLKNGKATDEERREIMVLSAVEKAFEEFGDFMIIYHDRLHAPSSCSRRRPDIELVGPWPWRVIIEVDERGSHHSKTTCDTAHFQERIFTFTKDMVRMNEISVTGDNIIPVIFIRFNPDWWTDERGIRHETKDNDLEWDARIDTLLHFIRHYTVDWEKDKTTIPCFCYVIYLFSDGALQQVDQIPVSPEDLARILDEEEDDSSEEEGEEGEEDPVPTQSQEQKRSICMLGPDSDEEEEIIQLPFKKFKQSPLLPD